MGDFNVDVTQDLFGRVLHFESKMDRGRYIDFDGLSFHRDMGNYGNYGTFNSSTQDNHHRSDLTISVD